MGALALVVYRLGGDGAACGVFLFFLGWGCFVLRCFAFFKVWDLAWLMGCLGLLLFEWIGWVEWRCFGWVGLVGFIVGLVLRCILEWLVVFVCCWVGVSAGGRWSGSGVFACLAFFWAWSGGLAGGGLFVSVWLQWAGHSRRVT